MLVVFVWVFWFVIWLNLVGWSIFGVTGLAVVSGDIRRSWIDIEEADLNQVVDNDRLKEYRDSLNAGNNAGSQTHCYYGNVWSLRPMTSEDAFFVAVFLALAAAIDGVMTTITVFAMPHWPRWGYLLFACGWPLVGIVIFHGLIWRELYNWRLVTADLMHWHQVSSISIEAIALAAGLLTVWLGRPVTRGLVRFIVPPKRRGVFAYLWLADGKTPPKTV